MLKTILLFCNGCVSMRKSLITTDEILKIWTSNRRASGSAIVRFSVVCCYHELDLNPNKFPSVTLRELNDVEDIFEINVMVYSLELDSDSPKQLWCSRVVKSTKEPCMWICTNHTLVLFSTFLNTVNCMSAHAAVSFGLHTISPQCAYLRCSSKTQLRWRCLQQQKTVFDQLKQLRSNVPHDDRFCPYRSTFDYERYFDKNDLPDTG